MIRATLRGTLAVTAFEGRRSLAPGRWALWAVLAGFPIAIVSIVKVLARQQPPDELAAWAVLMFVLTQLTSVLGVLLWASPAIQVELESRTWMYNATRPYGRRCLLLGRYLVAVLWSMSAGAAAVVVCCLIARPPSPLATTATLLALSWLSCAGFGALYSMLAVLFPKRAMAVAFGFSLVFEMLIAFVPAMINQLTIQFRLRCLLVRWLGFEEQVQSNLPLLFSEASTLHHLSMLAIYIAVMLLLAVVMLENKELAGQEE